MYIPVAQRKAKVNPTMPTISTGRYVPVAKRQVAAPVIAPPDKRTEEAKSIMTGMLSSGQATTAPVQAAPKQTVSLTASNLLSGLKDVFTKPIESFKQTFVKPKSEPMRFKVGAGLSNETTVLPGPRVSTLEAMKRGEIIKPATPLTPPAISPKTLAKETVQKNIEIAKTEPSPFKIKDLAPLVQFPQRTVTSIGLELPAGILSLIQKKKVEAKFIPTTDLQRMLLGEEPITGMFTEAKEAEKSITPFLTSKLKIDKDTAQGMSLALSSLFVGGLKGIDLTPFGGVEKNLARELALADDIARASKILRKAGIEETIIKAYAPKFVNEKTVQGVQKGLDSLKKLVETTSGKGLPALPKITQEIKPLAGKKLTVEPGAFKGVPVETSLQSKAVGEVKPLITEKIKLQGQAALDIKEPGMGETNLFKQIEKVKKSEVSIENIKTRPELFQQTRSLEKLKGGGFEEYKVGEVLKNFDEKRLLDNPITVGKLDGDLVVTSGHNRLEMLKRAKQAGLLTKPDSAYINVVKFEDLKAAIKESIESNIKSKSIKDINAIDLLIKNKITDAQFKNALAFDETKIKYLKEVSDTFKNNNLQDFWEKTVGRELSVLKDLDFGVMQEKLNFVNQTAKQMNKAIKNFTPEQAQAVKNTMADKIAEVLRSGQRSLNGVETSINKYLQTIETGGFDTKQLVNLFGETVSATEVAAKSKAQVLNNLINRNLKSTLISKTQRSKLQKLSQRILERDPATLEYINKNSGQLIDSQKTRNALDELLKLPDKVKTKFDTPEIIKLRELNAKMQPTNLINTPERIKLREDIGNKLYGKGALKKEKRIDIVIGPPAAGKSNLFAEPLVKEHGALLVDNDLAKRMLPEGIDYAGVIHEESADIVEGFVLKKAMKSGDNIVLPILGKTLKKLQDFMDVFELNGYKVHLHFNDLPIEKSAQRAIERFKGGGQFIDPDYILSIGDLTIKKNYDILKLDRRIKTYEQFSNDVPKGQKPKFIERGGEGLGVAGERNLGQGYRDSEGSIRGIAEEIKPALLAGEIKPTKAGFFDGKKSGLLAKEKITPSILKAKPLEGEPFLKGLKKEISEKVSKRTPVIREKVKGKIRLEKLKATERLRTQKARISGEKKVLAVMTERQRIENRREFVKAAQKQFDLSDTDIRKINQRDIRNMSTVEYKNFLDNFRIKAMEIADTREAKNRVLNLVREKELQRVDSLRKAMEFPPIEKMNIDDLGKLEAELEKAQVGDVFLTQRELETVAKTDLGNIKTIREAREKLAQELKIPVDQLENIKVTELDRLRFDTALAERNPFYKMMVEETHTKLLAAEEAYLKEENIINELVIKARKSRKRGLIEKMIPTDEAVFKYMSGNIGLAKKMTSEELELANYLQMKYADALDYLVKNKILTKGRSNYITNTRRGFLEAVKDDGLNKAFGELLDAYKQDEQIFQILDQSTKDILPLEKFFQFSLQRGNKINPTQNIAKATGTYFRTLEKKKALDALIPKIDIYTQAMTPRVLTPKGLEMDRRLKTFVNEWLNTKKGRRTTLIAKQGGKIDITLNAIRSFVYFKDLALSLPVGLASLIGEQVSTFVNLGNRLYAKGVARYASKQGRKIISEYRNFIGKDIWSELTEPSKNIGDKLTEGMFGMFAQSTAEANKIHLLGSLTDAEFAAGKVSTERLAQMRLEVGKFRMLGSGKSILGSTPEGQILTQYKTWAIPIFRTIAKDLTTISKNLLKGDIKKTLTSRELKEILRAAEISSAVIFLGNKFLDEEDDSYLGKLTKRMYMEALTVLGALDTKAMLAAPRLVSFVENLGIAISNIVKLEKYKTKDEYIGVQQLKKEFKPGFIRQFESKTTPSTKAKGPLPGLPALPKLPSLPKLPKL
jgi:hypothetical protein